MDRVGTAHAVGGEARVALEVLQRPCGGRTVDAVDPTAVEAEPRQRGLEVADVVTAEVGRDQDEQAVAELPRRLDERTPGLLVALAGRPESAVVLEPDQGRFGGRAKKTRLGTGRSESGGAEAALQVSDGLAALTGSQWEAVRNSSSSWSRPPLGLAPTIFFLTSPSCNTSRVGMLITL